MATVALAVVLGVGLVVAIVDPFTVLFYVTYAATGAWLVFRRPHNAIGWLLIAIAFGLIGLTASGDVDAAAVRTGTAGAGDTFRAWLAGWLGTVTFLGFFALMVVFPTGRLPGGRWRLPVQAILTTGVVLIGLAAIAPTVSFNPNGASRSVAIANPLALLPDLPFWPALPSQDALVLPLVILLLAGVISIVVRYRRSRGILRLQLRWLVAALAFMVAAVLTALLLLQLFGERIGGLAWAPVVVAYPMIPIAIGFAVLRYRLFEIDRLVSRTISYAAVTGLLGSLFVILILGLQEVLEPFTQRQSVAIAASTLAVAALFQPVLRRVRREVDHRFDRARYDGEQTATAFSERLRAETDLATVTADLSATARSALAPTSLEVWLRPGHAR